MAAAALLDRHVRVRVAARRRALRARVVAAASVAAAAWCGHAAMALGADERVPLGPVAPAAAGDGAAWEATRLLLALAVVVGIAFAARWWIRRSGVLPGLRAGAFDVLARHPVGRGEHVVVARFGPRLLCIHHGRGGMRTLAELTAPAEVSAAVAECRGLPPADGARTIDLRRGTEHAP